MGQYGVLVVLLVVFLTDASNNPCDPLTTECSGGDCCRGCFLKLEGTLCRKKNSSCDKPEYCTGKEKHCPRNTYLPDGVSCGDGANTCYKGLCLGKIIDSEDVIGKTFDETLKDEKQREESAALSLKETMQKRNAPRAPKAAIKSGPPTSKNALLVTFIAVVVTAVIMLVICAYTCVGFYRERDMRYKLEKAKVAVEPGNLQTYHSLINDIYVHYDVAVPKSYQSQNYLTGQKKRGQKTNKSSHYYTGLTERYYAGQSELDPLYYVTDDSRQLEQGDNALAEYYQSLLSGETDTQTTDQPGLKPNIQSQLNKSGQSKGGRVLTQTEENEPGLSGVGNINQSERIQYDRPETYTNSKSEQSQPHLLEVYSSIQSQQHEPEQLKVYSSIQSEQHQPDQSEVYSFIQSELSQHDADQSLSSQTHELQRNYYQPLTSFEDLSEWDTRYQQLNLAQPSSNENTSE